MHFEDLPFQGLQKLMNSCQQCCLGASTWHPVPYLKHDPQILVTAQALHRAMFFKVLCASQVLRLLQLQPRGAAANAQVKDWQRVCVCVLLSMEKPGSCTYCINLYYIRTNYIIQYNVNCFGYVAALSRLYNCSGRYCSGSGLNMRTLWSHMSRVWNMAIVSWSTAK